jgi:hypothetical protein
MPDSTQSDCHTGRVGRSHRPRRHADAGTHAGKVDRGEVCPLRCRQPVEHDGGGANDDKCARDAAGKTDGRHHDHVRRQAHGGRRCRTDGERHDEPFARTRRKHRPAGHHRANEIAEEICRGDNAGIGFAPSQGVDHLGKNRRIDEAPDAERGGHGEQPA